LERTTTREVSLEEKVDGLEGKQYNSLVEMTGKKSLAKGCDEFEFKLRHVDSGLEKIASIQTALFSQQQQIQAQRRRSSNTTDPRSLYGAGGGKFCIIFMELRYDLIRRTLKLSASILYF